jgi:hypothetical protein
MLVSMDIFTCVYPILVQVRLHILVEIPSAKSLFHVGKSWNNSRGVLERARITQRPLAKEGIPLFVEHVKALQQQQRNRILCKTKISYKICITLV